MAHMEKHDAKRDEEMVEMRKNITPLLELNQSRQEGKLPSQVETNPKGHVGAITLLSGKNIDLGVPPPSQ